MLTDGGDEQFCSSPRGAHRLDATTRCCAALDSAGDEIGPALGVSMCEVGQQGGCVSNLIAGRTKPSPQNHLKCCEASGESGMHLPGR